MRFSTARFLSLATLVSGLALFVFVPGCSQQGEGERCGDDDFGTTGSDDCGDGLVCTAKSLLVANGNNANRCCYPDRARVTDARCQASTATASGGAGGGDTTAEAGLGGEGG